jgi:peptide/nickel transport system substrate-binding protein
MSVQFRFKPMTWADGTPVTAADSVYSFQLDADPITPGSKFKIERTESYTAVDDLTVRWVGIPGYLDPDYFTNVWQPLPRHQFGCQPNLPKATNVIWSALVRGQLQPLVGLQAH